MPEQFLHGPNVVPCDEQVGGEAVAQGVQADGFRNSYLAGGCMNSLLQYGFVKVVSLRPAKSRVAADLGTLTDPFTARAGLLPG